MATEIHHSVEQAATQGGSLMTFTGGITIAVDPSQFAGWVFGGCGAICALVGLWLQVQRNRREKERRREERALFEKQMEKMTK